MSPVTIALAPPAALSTTSRIIGKLATIAITARRIPSATATSATAQVQSTPSATIRLVPSATPIDPIASTTATS